MWQTVLVGLMLASGGGDLKEQVSQLKQESARLDRELAAAKDRVEKLERKLAEVYKTHDAMKAENARLSALLEKCRKGVSDDAGDGFGQEPTPLTPANLKRAMDTPDVAKRALFASRAIGNVVRWSGEVLAAGGAVENPFHVMLYCDGVLVALSLAGKGACETPRTGQPLHFVGDVAAVEGDATYGVKVVVRRAVGSHDGMKIYPLEQKFRRP